MFLTIKNGTLVLQGILNESADFSLLKTQEGELHFQSLSCIFADLSAVERANSLGLHAWFKQVQLFNKEIVYVRAPVWLVEQLSFTSNLSHKSRVQSFFAQFYCKEKDIYELKLLTLGENIEIKNDYSTTDLNYSNQRGEFFEPDFIPEEYLYFLTRLWTAQKMNRGAS